MSPDFFSGNLLYRRLPMSQETLKMSRKERKRSDVMLRHKRGEILLKEAAWLMRVSVRQAIRVKQKFEKEGDAGLVHKSRDQPSNRGYPKDKREEILKIFRENYSDFGPTLASEKMLEIQKIKVNRETLRRWLIAECLWKVGEKGRVHRTKRKRRERFGEMLQIDGSDHVWFEERGEKSTLMVLIDDATGRIMLHMAKQETTNAALKVVEKWVRKNGVPESIYADRRSVYFTEEFVLEPTRRDDPATFTRFMRVTDRLGVRMIPAHSPQAKGRVERANRTLQDRLVKELRLLGISTIDEANAMLDDYADKHNRQRAVMPARQGDAHRTAPKGRQEWEYFFCYEESRTVAKDNTVVFKGEQWQIFKQKGGPRPKAKVTLRAPLSATPPYWLFGQKRLRTKYLGRVRPRAA
jgi:hypothetical protein